jgi:hypothetical protein
MSDEPWIPTAEGPPATLREALEDCYRVDRLREFARALNVGGPTRKAEVAAAVAEVMLGGEGTRALQASSNRRAREGSPRVRARSSTTWSTARRCCRSRAMPC